MDSSLFPFPLTSRLCLNKECSIMVSFLKRVKASAGGYSNLLSCKERSTRFINNKHYGEKSDNSNCSDISTFNAQIISLVASRFTTSAFCEQIREQSHQDMKEKQNTLISTLTIFKTKIHKLYQHKRRTTPQITNLQLQPVIRNSTIA